jgi:hypothetical protein
MQVLGMPALGMQALGMPALGMPALAQLPPLSYRILVGGNGLARVLLHLHLHLHLQRQHLPLQLLQWLQSQEINSAILLLQVRMSNPTLAAAGVYERLVAATAFN